MASYDSAGYGDQLPGFEPQNSHDYGTAPGSAGISPGRAGPVIGSPAVTAPHESAQLPVPREDVHAGDTFSTSSGVPVPVSVFCPPGADVTGAGTGRGGHHAHPNGNGSAS